jgi:hypothetical protein
MILSLGPQFELITRWHYNTFPILSSCFAGPITYNKRSAVTVSNHSTTWWPNKNILFWVQGTRFKERMCMPSQLCDYANPYLC